MIFIINKHGFTYMMMLVLITVTGITLSSASKYWSTVVKRDKEKELFFRGDQIRLAIESYYKSSPSGRPSYPHRIEDLLKDPRFMGVRRHLRKAYKNPITQDGQWGFIIGPGNSFKGVFSKSLEKPIKIAGFSKEYKDFTKAKTYSDWKFVYNPGG
ncbi:hypothetical protein GMMP1_730017 [Candidatus Magnetomoraceae bacterium gMMP-1]